MHPIIQTREKITRKEHCIKAYKSGRKENKYISVEGNVG
jgi:hypothetical protein